MDLATEPSHRLAGNIMVIAFEADPAIVRAYVPEPLELDGSGLIFLRTVEQWLYTDRNSTEFVSPERVNFTESFFWIPCDYQGERYHYMLYSWVNRDWLAYLGRQAGMPHKIAKVQMTNFHPSDPVYNGPREGVRVCASVENVGLVLRAELSLKQRTAPQDMPFKIGDGDCPRYVGHRYVYDVVEDRPALNDLVVHWGDDFTLGEMWAGEASLTFYEAENEEVLPFQPRRMIGGWWYTQLFNHGSSRPQVLFSIRLTCDRRARRKSPQTSITEAVDDFGGTCAVVEADRIPPPANHAAWLERKDMKGSVGGMRTFAAFRSNVSEAGLCCPSIIASQGQLSALSDNRLAIGTPHRSDKSYPPRRVRREMRIRVGARSIVYVLQRS